MRVVYALDKIQLVVLLFTFQVARNLIEERFTLINLSFVISFIDLSSFYFWVKVSYSSIGVAPSFSECPCYSIAFRDHPSNSKVRVSIAL
jgi:hypothetical protein